MAGGGGGWGRDAGVGVGSSSFRGGGASQGFRKGVTGMGRGLRCAATCQLVTGMGSSPAGWTLFGVVASAGGIMGGKLEPCLAAGRALWRNHGPGG